MPRGRGDARRRRHGDAHAGHRRRDDGELRLARGAARGDSNGAAGGGRVRFPPDARRRAGVRGGHRGAHRGLLARAGGGVDGVQGRRVDLARPVHRPHGRGRRGRRRLPLLESLAGRLRRVADGAGGGDRGRVPHEPVRVRPGPGRVRLHGAAAARLVDDAHRRDEAGARCDRDHDRRRLQDQSRRDRAVHRAVRERRQRGGHVGDGSNGRQGALCAHARGRRVPHAKGARQRRPLGRQLSRLRHRRGHGAAGVAEPAGLRDPGGLEPAPGGVRGHLAPGSGHRDVELRGERLLERLRHGEMGRVLARGRPARDLGSARRRQLARDDARGRLGARLGLAARLAAAPVRRAAGRGRSAHPLHGVLVGPTRASPAWRTTG